MKMQNVPLHILMLLMVESSCAAHNKEQKKYNPPRNGRILEELNPFSRRHKHPVDVIRSHGYPVETYLVTTQDGYILTLNRIPCGRKKRCTENRPVVYLQHGLLCSDSIWVIQTPSKGLGYILADAGYDVWMGNYRGGTYGRNHTKYNPNDSEKFWQFSWDEMAKYDLPALIEKVLQLSGKSELQYIGHSMGTTTFFALHHYRKDIAKKIKLAHLLSPVGYLSNAISPAVIISGKGVGKKLMDVLGIREFLPNNNVMDVMSSKFCNRLSHHLGLCTNFLFALFGYDHFQMNTTLVETIMNHLPAGTSVYTMMQFEQVYLSGVISGFDWGSERANYLHHGSKGIPKYRLQDVTTPVAAYYGLNDWLAVLPDLKFTLAELPHLVRGMVHEIAFPLWNHIDFVFAIDADRYVYKPLLQNMRTCEIYNCRDLEFSKNTIKV